MTVRVFGLLLATTIAACGGGRDPEGANQDARFLLIEPETAPNCGAVRVVPARGAMPSFDDLADHDAWLFQLNAEALSDLGAAGDPVFVYAVRDDIKRWGSGLVEVPTPEKTWHWAGDRFDIVSTEETLPRLAPYRLVEAPSCAAVVESLCALDEVTPCDTFVHADIRVPDTELGIGVAVPVDEETVLVSAADRTVRDEPAEFFLLREFSIDRVTNTSTHTPFGGAFIADDGEVWMYGPKGRFATWRSGGSFVLREPPVYQSGFVQSWLDGSRGGAPFELFALTDGGGFERYDGTNWNVVHNGEDFLEREGGVVWIGPGHAVAIGSKRNIVARYRDGVVDEVDLGPMGTGTRLSALAEIDGLGVVVGNDVGEIFVDDGSGFVSFAEAPRDGLEVNGMLPYKDGFLFGREIVGLDGGWAVQYVPGYGLCPAERVSEADLRRLSTMGPQSFFVIGEEVGRNSWVSLVKGESRAPVCTAK